MYLDTDIVLALIKKEDWLKEYVSPATFKGAKTSVLAVIEARLILLREYSRQEALECLGKIQALELTILPLNEKIIEKSNELMSSHEKLGIFDALHAACALVHGEELVSTDTMYREIHELKSRDPRAFSQKEE